MLTLSHITTRTFSTILALTLIATAMSVFAQEGGSSDADSIVSEAADVAMTVDDTSQPDPTTATAAQLVPTQATTQITDTYPRDQLGGGAVYNDFVVGPGRFDFQISPGERRTVELLVTNRTGEGKIFSLEVEDAEGSQTVDGGVTLLGDQIGPYTIKNYITVPFPQFYLEHNTRARIPVTVSLPPDAEPGGFYGSLLTSIVSRPADDVVETGSRPATAIISRIGTLFFITTPGDIARESKLLAFKTRNGQKFFSSGPIQLDIVNENSGTVHTTPSGKITVSNILGEEVGMVELESWFVMPRSVRTRSIEWDREALFGRYTATVDVNRGYGDIVDTLSYNFWVIPIKIVSVVFAATFIFFLLLRFILTRFEFKRKS